MRRLLPIFPLFLLCLLACKREQEKPYQPTAYELLQPLYFPTLTNIPAENPMTEEGVALGRKLFYDPRISGRESAEGITCCASCHHREKNFEFGASTGTHHEIGRAHV